MEVETRRIDGGGQHSRRLQQGNCAHKKIGPQTKFTDVLRLDYATRAREDRGVSLFTFPSAILIREIKTSYPYVPRRKSSRSIRSLPMRVSFYNRRFCLTLMIIDSGQLCTDLEVRSAH